MSGRIAAAILTACVSIVVATTVGGCSVIVAGPSKQCAADTDCPSNATCNEQGRCVEKPECVTTQDCIALGPSLGWQAYDDYIDTGYSGQPGGAHGMPGFGGPDGVGNDATGQAFKSAVKVPTRICAKGKCVPLRDPGDAQCAVNLDEQQLYGNPSAPNPIVIGLIGDINVNSPSGGTMNAPADANYALEHFYMRAAALPLLELRQAVGGGTVGGRDLLFVGCSQHRNPTRSAAPAAQHLVDLGATAIIGPTDGPSFQQAAQITVPAGIPLFSPFVMSNTAAQVSGSSGLLFFPSFFAQDVLAPLNAVLADRIAKLKSLPAAGPKYRVAVYYYSNDTFHEYDQLKSLVEQNLMFNDGSASSQSGTWFKEFEADLNDPAKAPNLVASQMIAWKPDIIIPFSGQLEWFGVFNMVEAALSGQPNLKTADGKAPATPVWVHPFIINEAPYATSNLVTANANNVVSRITGIRPARNALYSTIQAELDRFVGNTNISYEPGAARAYETSLLLFYSIAAGVRIHADAHPTDPLGALTGLDVTQGVTRVTTGMQTIEANPSSSILNSGLNLLNDGKAIKLDGVFSNLNFDDLHHTNVTWETFCVDTAGGLNVSSRTIDKTGALGQPVPGSQCAQLGF
jgi:hypothetical protein